MCFDTTESARTSIYRVWPTRPACSFNTAYQPFSFRTSGRTQ